MINKNFLVTGLAGSGKSTLQEKFRDRGYEALGIDEGFASWQNRDTGEHVEYTGTEPPEWHDINHWLLEKAVLLSQMQQPTPNGLPKLFFGFTADLPENTHLFNGVFLLAYPDDQTIRARAISRPDPEAYGKKPIELARIIADREPLQSLFCKLGAVAINCTRPVYETVSIIEREIAADASAD